MNGGKTNKKVVKGGVFINMTEIRNFANSNGNCNFLGQDMKNLLNRKGITDNDIDSYYGKDKNDITKAIGLYPKCQEELRKWREMNAAAMITPQPQVTPVVGGKKKDDKKDGGKKKDVKKDVKKDGGKKKDTKKK